MKTGLFKSSYNTRNDVLLMNSLADCHGIREIKHWTGTLQNGIDRSGSSPGESEVVAVELERFGVVLQVEVGVAQLTVDGAEDLQVFRPYLDGGLEEGDACAVIACLTQTLALQRQLQTRRLHPGHRTIETEL